MKKFIQLYLQYHAYFYIYTKVIQVFTKVKRVLQIGEAVLQEWSQAYAVADAMQGVNGIVAAPRLNSEFSRNPTGGTFSQLGQV